MGSESIIDSLRTNLIVRFPFIRRNDRLKQFFGLPKSIDAEYIDDEQYSWSSNTLLCAAVFIEDAKDYKSIVHKITREYLIIYRWFSSSMIKTLHQMILMINLSLVLFERPSSFSKTSDVRDLPNRIIFPYTLWMIIEFLTLSWLLIYILTKIICLGIKHIRKRFWIIVFLMSIIYSLCEWFTIFIIVGKTYENIHFRRILRPIFMIESSQLMKKVFKALQNDLLTIIACISLIFIHILFFAAMAMFLFPRSDIRPDSQGNIYFSSLHDSIYHLLVLYSTANNPDVMIPAYSERRLNVLFFIVFVIIGIYCIQNIITAVVYRAFRGYFLNSIVNSLLKRRIAIRAAFEILKKRISSDGFIEIRDTIPISLVRTVLNTTSIDEWHLNLINEKLTQLMNETDVIDAHQFCQIMQALDLNPRLASEVYNQILNTNWSNRIKIIVRSKIFDFIGTIFSILSVLLVTIEVSHRNLNTDANEKIKYDIPLTFINLSLIVYFVIEIIMKAWAYEPIKFFRSSTTHILEAAVAFTCLILQLIYIGIHGTSNFSFKYINVFDEAQLSFTLWAASKICNMLLIYRLVRFLPASKNIQVIVGTVVDELRNGGAFFGILFSCYYAYSIIGMELFGNKVEELYIRYNRSNITICGTYEQLEYWPNGFDDFYSSIITLYNIMIVNQWYVFVNGFRSATQSKWSELYFIFWYLFVTTIGLNICLALSGDIHDAKKKRAEQHEELIVSNMYDIYRSNIKEPLPEEIIQRLNEHPYIDFNQNSDERIIII